MTKNEIIEEIANKGTLHTLIQNIGGTTDPDLKDLEQDLYLDLYTKSEKTLQELYEKDQLNFYLARMVTNNIHSSTSRYYTKYKKPRLISDKLTTIEEDDRYTE